MTTTHRVGSILKIAALSVVFGFAALGGELGAGQIAAKAAPDPAVYSQPGTWVDKGRTLPASIQLVGTNGSGTATSNPSDYSKTDTMVNTDTTSLDLRFTIKNPTSIRTMVQFLIALPANGETTLSNSLTEDMLKPNAGTNPPNWIWYFGKTKDDVDANYGTHGWGDYRSQNGNDMTGVRWMRVTGFIDPGDTYSVDLPLAHNSSTSVQHIDLQAYYLDNDTGYNVYTDPDVIYFRYAAINSHAQPTPLGVGQQFMGTQVISSNVKYKLLPADIQALLPTIKPDDIAYYNSLFTPMSEQAPQSVLFEGGYEGIKQSALDEVKGSVQNAGYSLLIKSSGSSFVPAYTNYQYTPSANGPEIVDESGNVITSPQSNIFYGPYITLRQVVKTKASSMNVGDTVTPANSFDSYLPSSVSVNEEDDAKNRVSTLDNNIKVSISDPNGVLNADHTKALRTGTFNITYTYDVGQSTTGTPSYPVSATATVTVNPTGTPSNGGGTTTPSGGGGTTAPSNGGSTTAPSNGGGTTTLPTSPIIATKGEAVYAVRSIGLYKTANFTKATRRATYVKKPRVNRPMFVVTGYAKASNGALRYKVRDVNHKSVTAGMTGYITASTNYVLPVYYQRSYSKITVINPSGIKAYKNVNLTGAAKAYKQGTVLTVVGIEHHNLTTRFLLSNGKYITGNRKLVIAGAVKMVKLVKTKTAVNRYKTANLTGRNGVLKKSKTYRVYGFAYSRPTSTKASGTLRYRVAGGYITANNKVVKAYQ